MADDGKAAVAAIRPRTKERKHYTEDCINDEEIEGKRMFSVEEKLLSDRYDASFVKDMKGDELNLNYIQENGFVYPICIRDKAGLGMRLPSKNFTVNDVRQCVGSRRMLDVMDVTTQRDIEMSMRDWVKYYEDPQRDKLLNVISLEFSHTKLENYIESPQLVRDIDWVDCVWPKHLKQSQTESTNIIEDMKYPKVQKYCLMSVKGCYTDFHIDFGGTSVWYHILHGKKVFWLIPPTERNIQLYEQWVLSGKQGDVFFGDTVDECGRIELEEGWTFFIPTGWIHAVFTPKDSLVFGGNFLHSFGIEKQLRIAQVEDVTHVPVKFRYPFYTEMLWYVLARYVQCTFGRCHVRKVKDDGGSNNHDTASINRIAIVHGAALPAAEEDDRHNDFDRNHHQPAPSSVDTGPLAVPLSPQIASPAAGDGVLSPGVPKLDAGGSAASGAGGEMVTPRMPRLEREDLDGGDDAEGKENRWSPAVGGGDYALPFEVHVPLHEGWSAVYAKSPAAVAPPPPSTVASAAEPDDAGHANHVHLTRFEINGIKAIVRWLAHLPASKRAVPDLIKDPGLLLNDVKVLLENHKCDDSKLAVTGKPVLTWPDMPKKTPRPPKPKPIGGPPGGGGGGGKSSSSKGSGGKSSANSRRRRTRCKKCEACLRADCGDCHFCKDMKKFGGPGRMKQSCISRQCMAPILPHTACCMLCGLDGFERGAEGGAGKGSNAGDDDNSEEEASSLMECSLCWEIVHPECLIKKYEAAAATANSISDDLPNSWECPKCVAQSGKGPKLRHIKPSNAKPGDTSPYPSGETLIKRAAKENLVSPSVDSAPCLDEGPEILDLDTSALVKRKFPLEMGEAGPKRLRILTGEAPRYKSSDSEDEQNHMREKITPRSDKKKSDSKSKKKVNSNLSKSKNANESHVRSCVRQGVIPIVNPEVIPAEVFTMFSSNKLMEIPKQELSNIVGTPVLPGDERATLRGLMNCQIKVLKLDDSTPQHPLAVPKRGGNSGSLVPNNPMLPLASPDVNNVAKLRRPSPIRSSGGVGPAKSPGKTAEGKGGRPLKMPMYVVRPAPILDGLKLDVRGRKGSGGGGQQSAPHGNQALDKEYMRHVFGYLRPSDLGRCMLVCKTWNAWCLDRRLWSRIDLAQRKITASHLAGIVRRQPSYLGLGWTNISKKLLSWLMARLPQLRYLDLSGLSWVAVAGLSSCSCPPLHSLDLRWVEGLSDARLRELLAPPSDSRPGLAESRSRLRQLSELKLSGCAVTDVALRYLTQHLRLLTSLELGHCALSDAGVALLVGVGSPVRESLVRLDLSGCRKLTDSCLEHLSRCPALVHLDLRHCPDVSVTACRKFIAQSKHPLMMAESKLVEKQVNYLHRTFTS